MGSGIVRTFSSLVMRVWWCGWQAVGDVNGALACIQGAGPSTQPGCLVCRCENTFVGVSNSQLACIDDATP